MIIQPDYVINDKWIMDRISSQSTSFNKWISGFIHRIENALEKINISQLPFIERGKFNKEMDKAKNELANTKKEFVALDLDSLGSKIGEKPVKWVSNLIQKEIHDKLPKSEL